MTLNERSLQYATIENGTTHDQVISQEEQKEVDDKNSTKPETKPVSSSVQVEKRADVASWISNIVLLAAKAFVVAISGSKSVTAALADSIVDLLSQGILSTAQYYMKVPDPNYPVGKFRLEALGVIASATLMIMASVEVIQMAAVDIFDGMHGKFPELSVDLYLYVILGVGIAMKVVLWYYCDYASSLRGEASATMAALAEDHFNDVISNSAALVTVTISSKTTAW